METKDASAELLLKFWSWYDANKKRLIIGAVMAVVAWVVWFYVATQHDSAETAAGLAYTEFQFNQPAKIPAEQVVAGYLKIADDYPGTISGQRAQLQAATILFSDGKYADALKQFQDFLAKHSGSSLTMQAQSGVAASLEAQGKLDDALAAYRKVADSNKNSPEATLAEFSQGRVLELQGKLNGALSSYQQVVQSPMAASLASEAAQRISIIQAKLAVAKPLEKADAKSAAKS